MASLQRQNNKTFKQSAGCFKKPHLGAKYIRSRWLNFKHFWFSIPNYKISHNMGIFTCIGYAKSFHSSMLNVSKTDIFVSKIVKYSYFWSYLEFGEQNKKCLKLGSTGPDIWSEAPKTHTHTKIFTQHSALQQLIWPGIKGWTNKKPLQKLFAFNLFYIIH